MSFRRVGELHDRCRSGRCRQHLRRISVVTSEPQRHPLQQFIENNALESARLAEGDWRSPNSIKMDLAWTLDSVCPNQAGPQRRRAGIELLLIRKWSRELDCRLVNDLWGHNVNREPDRECFRPPGRSPSGHLKLSNSGL
ncbi:DUF1348 family protein [Roseobacter sp. A03A-229]